MYVIAGEKIHSHLQQKVKNLTNYSHNSICKNRKILEELLGGGGKGADQVWLYTKYTKDRGSVYFTKVLWALSSVCNANDVNPVLIRASSTGVAPG